MRNTGPKFQGDIRLPVEVWECIIDIIASKTKRNWDLRNSPWWRTLHSCALTYRMLHDRARWHLSGSVRISSRDDVVSLSKALRREPHLRQAMRFITIVSHASDWAAGTPYIGTFAVMLAGLMPNAEALELREVTWRTGVIRPEYIACLAAFRSLRELTLAAVRFPTATQFTRLLAALPHLRTLQCDRVFCYQKSPSVAPLSPPHGVPLRALFLWDHLDPVIFHLLLSLVERSGELHHCSVEGTLDRSAALEAIESVLRIS